MAWLRSPIFTETTNPIATMAGFVRSLPEDDRFLVERDDFVRHWAQVS